MNIGRVIDWLGQLSGAELPEYRRCERIMQFDSVMRASIILNTKECTLVRLHDIEGHTVEDLHVATGVPGNTIRQNVIAMRQRLNEMINRESEPEEVQASQEGES